MRIIPVLDIQRHQAVHAVAGNRAHYEPLRSVWHQGSDPFLLASGYRLRQPEPTRADLYIADLDAIAGTEPDFALFRALADLGLTLWVDAGLRDGSGVERLLAAGVGTIVAGLESLKGPKALAAIVDRAGPERVVFSLDLREGRPWIDTADSWRTVEPLALADRAIAIGVCRVLLLDIARVGTGQGTGTSALLRDLQANHGDKVEYVVGGGVSGPEDLASLAAAGASNVLVGSAVHEGRIAPGHWDIG